MITKETIRKWLSKFKDGNFDIAKNEGTKCLVKWNFQIAGKLPSHLMKQQKLQNL